MDSGKHGTETSGFIKRQESSHLAKQLLCPQGEGRQSAPWSQSCKIGHIVDSYRPK